ncbi:trypsin-like peptidase domain-containing protein [Candidatus Sumerlaeota bacterium]|nr:trypsin-like peptidase domain-containing protein [Candidatus Sumerlaeota bacterium]
MRKIETVIIGINFVLLAVILYLLANGTGLLNGNSTNIQVVPTAEAKRIDIIERQTELVTAAQKASKAVVCISVVKRGYMEDFFRPFLLYPYEEKIPYLGSGFIIDDKGHILTNYHVIEGAEEVFVTLVDGREVKGKVLGADAINDVALLKIDAEKIPRISIGNSDDVMIGEWVLAIGNPFGKLIEDPRPTVTFGVISALNRSFKPDPSSGHVYLNMIQTDAAINPGNSGGPLVNIAGEVIGINTFIVSKTGASHGIGFAIPINRAMKVAREIMKYGRIRSLWLDFTCINLSPYLARLVKAPDLNGALIRSIDRGGEAERCGLKVGDVVIKANDKKINSATDLVAYIATLQVGDKIKFVILRNGRKMSITYEVKEYKGPRITL